MSKISDAFSKKKAFVAFVTCGDPDLKTTKEIIRQIAKAGASVIELGIPFSDPTAEGPVIFEASMRALKSGTTTEKVFCMVEEIKDEIDVPLAFMTYANVVYSYGIERFAKRMKDCGVTGLILPDVPFEEKEEFSSVLKPLGLDLISLIAPTSCQRIEMIAKEAEGFVYLVSSLGVTGERTSFFDGLKTIVQQIKQQTKTPVAIGFGISNPKQAKKMADIADGVIVGSAIVKIIAEFKENSPKKVFEFVKEMTDALSKN